MRTINTKLHHGAESSYIIPIREVVCISRDDRGCLRVHTGEGPGGRLVMGFDTEAALLAHLGWEVPPAPALRAP